MEAEAALLLQDLKSQAERRPDDPETAAILLYLSEREWSLAGDQDHVRDQIARAILLREKANLAPTMRSRPKHLQKWGNSIF